MPALESLPFKNIIGAISSYNKKALNSLIATFHNYDENMEELSENLWAYGHPMKFIA